MLSERLHQELSGLAFIGPDYRLDPIPEGAINQNFCLQAKDKCYLLKVFADNQPVPLDRKELFGMQRQLAKQGFASPPLYLSDEHQFWLESWLALTTVSDSSLGMAARLHLLAKRLAEIHGLNITTQVLDLAQDWQHYLGRIPDNRQLQQHAERWLPLWQSLEKSTFCHHDLSFSHLCLSDTSLTLDWEYAALSHPALDVANACLVNGLNAQQERVLCHLYGVYRDLDGQAFYQQVECLKPLSELTARLWYLACNNRD